MRIPSSGLLLLLSVPVSLALACGGSERGGRTAGVRHQQGGAHDGDGSFPWEKEPGPIEGRWRADCDRFDGMVLEVESDGGEKMVGRIAELGQLGKYGYSAGDEILRVSSHRLGKWVGEIQRRWVTGESKWESIHLVSDNDTLDAVIYGDDCFKSWSRAD